MIPMVDLKTQYQALQAEIEPKIQKALAQCLYILGPNVTAFEQEAASYLGVKHAIGVANGTDSLHLALLANGIGADDEVITTAFSFIATAEAITYTGASIKFADINPKTFNIDPKSIEQQITKKTKAVLVVHLFGQPVDMPEIKKICDHNGLKLIEDCCQSFGATIEGQQTGSFGDAGCFSFFPSKNLGGFGDGGLLSTNNDEIAENVKALRNHGMKVRYHHSKIGYNSRLDELQAVILRVKLPLIDSYNSARNANAQKYSELLQDLPIQAPFEDNIGFHIYHQYTLLSEKRDQISQALNQQQIANAIYYPIPLHRQKVYLDMFKEINLPNTQAVAHNCLSLPMFPELKHEQIEKITSVIKSVF